MCCKHTRWLCTLLVLPLLLSLLLPVSAEASLEDAIISSCTTGDRVDLSRHSLTIEELNTVYLELVHTGRIPWYSRQGFEYYHDNGLVTVFCPKSLDPAAYDRVLYDLRQQEVLQAALHEGMTQTQQALAIHDHLIVNSFFDEPEKYYEGYDLLVRGTAVCEGYAEAYMDLLNRIGIPCIMVISEPMNHAWNLVQLDGSWYHVDLTWDDPVPDIQGQVLHTYFLVTDQEMEEDFRKRQENGDEEGHHSWQTELVCDSATYTDAFWKDVDSQICYLDSNRCLYRKMEDWNSCLYLRDEHTGEETRLYKDKREATNVGAGDYYYQHTGLSVWDDRLYFSTVDTVYSMAMDGSDRTPIYQHQPKKEKNFIYSSYVTRDTLYMTLSGHDIQETETLQIPLEPSGCHVHSYEETSADATCTQDGWAHYLCSCGISLELAGQEATGHYYISSRDAEPALGKSGRMAYICRDCQDTYYKTIPALTFWDWLTSALFA